MIANDRELRGMLDRLTYFQEQIAYLRETEKDPANYHASAAGYMREVDRMQREVRDYTSLHPTEFPRFS